MSPTQLQDVATFAVRETMEKSLDDVIEQEKKDYGIEIPMAAKGLTRKLSKNVANNIEGSESRATAEDIPESS